MVRVILSILVSSPMDHLFETRNVLPRITDNLSAYLSSYLTSVGFQTVDCDNIAWGVHDQYVSDRYSPEIMIQRSKGIDVTENMINFMSEMIIKPTLNELSIEVGILKPNITPVIRNIYTIHKKGG